MKFGMLEPEYFSYKEKYGWDEELPQEFLILHDSKSKWSLWYKGWLNHVGVHHRVNGPARIWGGGAKEYHLNGKYFPDVKSDNDWIIKQIIE